MVVSLRFFFVFLTIWYILADFVTQKSMVLLRFLNILRVWDTAGIINFIWKPKENHHLSSAKLMRNSSNSKKKIMENLSETTIIVFNFLNLF